MVPIPFSRTIKWQSTNLKKVIQSLPQSEKQCDENVAAKFGLPRNLDIPHISYMVSVVEHLSSQIFGYCQIA